MVKLKSDTALNLQPAYILHRRPFRETSFILDVWTREQGRLSLLAKGAKGLRSKWRGVLTPFSLLLIAFRGKTELMSLQTAELGGPAVFLQGESLAVGFYLNELLIKLIQKSDPHPVLFDAYQKIILQLANHQFDQKSLRLFEKKLLEEIGYGLFGNPIHENDFYYLSQDSGLVKCSTEQKENLPIVFSGKYLRTILTEDFSDPIILQEAKKLFRFAITHLLGNTIIQSRKLLL